MSETEAETQASEPEAQARGKPNWPNQQMVRPDGSGPGRPPEGTGGSGGSTPTATPHDEADAETDDQTAAETDDETAADLDAMTKDELLAEAQRLGVSPANASMTKDELRAGIEEYRAS